VEEKIMKKEKKKRFLFCFAFGKKALDFNFLFSSFFLLNEKNSRSEMIFLFI
jgi:hypothetical protein